MGSEVALLLLAAPPGRVFGLDIQTLFGIAVQLINTAILAVVLSKILYQPVRKFLAKRADRIAEQIDRAEEGMIKADEIRAEYEKKLEDIAQERLEVLETARKLGVEKRNEMLNEAKIEADAMRERVRTEMEREQERFKDEMKQYIIETSSVMAGKILAHSVDKETQDKLFADTLVELEEKPWLN